MFIILKDTIIIGPSDSERKADFQRNKQVIVDIIQRVVQDRKEGVWKRDVPFIDAMLQNYDSEIKVSLSNNYYCSSAISAVCYVVYNKYTYV